MAAVGFRLAERVYGLDQHEAQFLAGQLQRRLAVPEPIADLADQIWVQSMRNPDTEVSDDITLSNEQKRALVETMSRVSPDGDAAAWNALAEALRRELGQ